MGKSGIDKARRARLDILREAALHRHVAARLPAGFSGRWTRRQWAHASLFATLAALVGAIVPGFADSRHEGVAPTQAQTTLDSPPNLSDWVAVSGGFQFNLLHRFSVGSAPATARSSGTWHRRVADARGGSP